MHSSGVDEPVITRAYVKQFIEAGADIILVPAVGTVPGFDEAQLKDIVKEVHREGDLSCQQLVRVKRALIRALLEILPFEIKYVAWIFNTLVMGVIVV